MTQRPHPQLPTDVSPYKRTPVFTESTVPAGLLKDHHTKAGVWGVIEVEAGRLRYVVPGRSASAVLEPGLPGLVMPEEPHHVSPLGPVRFSVQFWR